MQTLKEKYFDEFFGLIQKLVDFGKKQKGKQDNVYFFVESFENEINYSYSQRCGGDNNLFICKMRFVFESDNTLTINLISDELETGASEKQNCQCNRIAAENCIKRYIDLFKNEIKRIGYDLNRLSIPI